VAAGRRTAGSEGRGEVVVVHEGGAAAVKDGVWLLSGQTSMLAASPRRLKCGHQLTCADAGTFTERNDAAGACEATVIYLCSAHRSRPLRAWILQLSGSDWAMTPAPLVIATVCLCLHGAGQRKRAEQSLERRDFIGLFVAVEMRQEPCRKRRR